MPAKDSIFGSKSEARGFLLIEHTWGDRYRLCAQFPWSALFEPDPKWRGTSNLFFKTSVDYVLCTNEGRPLLAIDFDGMGGGFDREGEYVQVEATPDRNRKAKFDFKLRYAKANDFPYHIVASEGFNPLDDGIELTIVDGIIGSVMASKSFSNRAQTFVDEHADDIDSQPMWYKSEYIQYLLTRLEFDCNYDHNPIVRRHWDVRAEIEELTGKWFPWPESIRPYYPGGCMVTICDTPFGEVSVDVSVKGDGAAGLALDIAQLRVNDKLLRLLRRQS